MSDEQTRQFRKPNKSKGGDKDQRFDSRALRSARHSRKAVVEKQRSREAGQY